MIFRILLLSFTFFAICEGKYKENLAICAMFKDEAPWMKEWLEYHLLLGVDKFYLYNNNSSDEYAKVLAPYRKKGVVELIEWPSPPEEFWDPYQKTAYNDCIAKVRKKTKWLAIIDLDEFIVVTNGKTLPEALESYEFFGGVALFWQMFGTSGLWDIPEGKTMLESLIWKARVNYGPNINCKSIVRPERVKEYEIHGAHYHHPYAAHYVNGRRTSSVPLLDPMHINHYYTRTKNHYFEKKNARRAQVEGHLKSREEAARLFSVLRAVKDESVLTWVPKLRKRLGLKDKGKDDGRQLQKSAGTGQGTGD